METHKEFITENSLVKAIHENVNVHLNLNELPEDDLYWVKEHKGFQISDIKYPTFDDNNIEDQIRSEITFDTLNGDVNSLIELLLYFEKAFLQLLTSSNKQNVLKIFGKYSLNHINFIAYSVLSRRQITLIFYLIKLFDKNDMELLKLIEEEYRIVTVEKIVEEIFSITSILEIKKENEEFLEIFNIVKKNLEDEKKILSVEVKPSICGISISFKFLKSIVEKTILNLNKLQIVITEENIVDFLHQVNYFLIKIAL